MWADSVRVPPPPGGWAAAAPPLPPVRSLALRTLRPTFPAVVWLLPMEARLPLTYCETASAAGRGLQQLQTWSDTRSGQAAFLLGLSLLICKVGWKRQGVSEN